MFALENSKVAIVGLGLMGGSLALGLRGKCSALLAVETDPVICQLALDKAIVDDVAGDPASILPQADLIILCAPIPAILALLAHLDLLVPQAAIVMDIGSSKSAVVEAMATLPERFDVIGGHPICGKEKLSLENADAALYANAPFVLTPLPRTSVRASSAALQVISAVGANPIWMDAALHDLILATTSHLPFILASALVLATPENAAPLVGPGFRSAARLASTPASMMMGVLQTNRSNILNAISVFRENLAQLEQALEAQDAKEIQALLESARTKHQKFL